MLKPLKMKPQLKEPSLPLFTLIFFVFLLPSSLTNPFGRYQLFNYTWLIINEAGDIVSSVSSTSLNIPFPTLRVDLCALTLGADDASWGYSDVFWPQRAAPDLEGTTAANHGACYSWKHRLALRGSPFDVCPGSHRPQELNSKCGDRDSYFCASWGCQTTGDSWWNPSSDWDLISVRWESSSWASSYICQAHSNARGWCNPLLITFTNSGKQFNWLGSTKAEWGLRLYASGPDPGLTFSIKLLKETPIRKPVALGPNTVPAFSPVPDGVFQPTCPVGLASSSQLILDIVNASAAALTNPAYEHCWICFYPFYEGVATFGTPIPTNNAQDLRWKLELQHEFTLKEVVGVGLCLLGPNMRPPVHLLHICNQSMVLSNSAFYTQAPNLTYLACSTGLFPYVVNEVFLAVRDYCVLVLLVPRLTVRPESALLYSFTDSSWIMNKREPFSNRSIADLLSLGLAGTGTGIYSLISSRDDFHMFQKAFDRDIQELRHLKETVGSLAEVVQKNHRRLDLAFLKEGGICVALKEECCFLKNNLGLVNVSIRGGEEILEERRTQREKNESWSQNWFSTSPWLSTLLLFFGFLLLISFFLCAFHRWTAFIRTKVYDSTMKMVAVYFQHRELPITETPDLSNKEVDPKDVL